MIIQASIVYSSHSYEKLAGLHIRINQQYSMTCMWSDTQIRRGGCGQTNFCYNLI